MNFESIKNRLVEHKPKFIVLGCLIAAFISGYGVGTYEMRANNLSRRQLNYTTNTGSKPTPTSTPKPTASATPAQSGECYIKGSKSKLYHMPGGSFYDRTNPVQCFASEQEAVNAGYTKSSR